MHFAAGSTTPVHAFGSSRDVAWTRAPRGRGRLAGGQARARARAAGRTIQMHAWMSMCKCQIRKRGSVRAYTRLRRAKTAVATRPRAATPVAARASGPGHKEGGGGVRVRRGCTQTRTPTSPMTETGDNGAAPQRRAAARGRPAPPRTLSQRGARGEGPQSPPSPRQRIFTYRRWCMHV